MAVVPSQPDPRDVQRLIDLYQQVDRLNQSQAESMARIAASAGNINKEITRLERELNSVSDSFSSIAQSLKDSVQEFSRYNTTAANTKKTFSSLQSIASKLLSDQSGYSRLSEKELKKLQEKVALEAQNLSQNIASGNLTQEQAAEATDVLNRTAQLNALLEERLNKEREITKATGVTGNALKALSKIPGIGGALNTEEAIEDMKDLADAMKEKGENINTFSNRLKIAGAGLKTAFKGIKDSLTDPVSILLFFISKALEANKQAIELGKSLGYGVEKANELRENFALISGFSSNINVNSQSLIEAFGQLAQATGFATEFTADQLETQVKLTKQVGLQAEEAAQVQRLAILNGETSEETYKSFVRGLTAARNQLKVGINFKATLAEALKVSGQLAANLGYNPERITKAIVTAKAFGMTLEEVAKSGKALLNFESSIENELKAELLTGRQLNLERARAAALAGDQATLAEELAKNVGTAADFSKMNVLQQEALADSVGKTADELAETLRKREEAIASGKSLAQITEEEAAQALERQAIQEKFGAALLKIQDVVGNLVAGPFGQLLDLIANIASLLTTVISPVITGISYVVGLIVDGFKTLLPILLVVGGLLGVMYAKSIGLAIASVARNAFENFSFAGPIGPILATAATLAGVGLVKRLVKADDLMSEGYGKRTLTTPEGTFALNNRDTIVAGTDLGAGGGNNAATMPSIDLTPMITAINSVKAAVDRLYNKDTSINMDGKKVGTTLTQGSYKVA